MIKGIGVPVVTDYEIWKNNPEKVFGVTAEWARGESEHARRGRQGADPRRDVARRERQREPARGRRDPRAPHVRRRRHAP